MKKTELFEAGLAKRQASNWEAYCGRAKVLEGEHYCSALLVRKKIRGLAES
ncbi:MAG: hypothetical protein KF682_01275 [Nitrospira sp.]|nr:hypothetical protein [Nitrospira sp.]